MLTLDPVVHVNVSVAASAVAVTTCDVGLIVVSAGNTVAQDDRAKSYTNLASALADFSGDDNAAIRTAITMYFNANPTPKALVVGKAASGESVETALNAIRDKNGDWYGVYWVGADATKQQAIDEWLNAANFGIQFATVTGNSVDNVLSNTLVTNLATQGSRRTCLLYSTVPAEAAAIMGTAMGCSNEYNSATWQLCYKAIAGLTPVAISQTDLERLTGANISVYVPRRYTQNILERGATPSGFRVDEVIALDKLATEIQEACFDLIASSASKLPQTDSTSTQFISAITGVLERYANIGYIQPNIWRGKGFGNIETGDALEKGYSIWADSFDHQTAEDRAARKAMPIYVGICFCGSVESVVINVNVQE